MRLILVLLLCLCGAAPAKPDIADVEARIAAIERELAELKAMLAEIKGEKPVDLDAEAEAGNVVIGMTVEQAEVAIGTVKPSSARKARSGGGTSEIWDFDDLRHRGITRIRFANGRVVQVMEE